MKLATGLILASLVNKERAILGLSKVMYDADAHRFLDRNITDNSSYFYDTGNNYKSWTIEGNTRSCDLNGCFINFTANNKTFNYQLRDTMRYSIVKIFKYRIAQKNCDHTDFFDGAKCSWYYHYFPIMMQKDYTSFACKVMDGQGKFVPSSHKNRQFKNFWCFYDSVLPWFKY